MIEYVFLVSAICMVACVIAYFKSKPKPQQKSSYNFLQSYDSQKQTENLPLPPPPPPPEIMRTIHPHSDNIPPWIKKKTIKQQEESKT